MRNEMEILQGIITAVIYQNYDNGYAVLRLNCENGQTVTVVGTIPMPSVGERLMVTGKWSSHPTYGRQFEAEFLERLMPQTENVILSFLSSRVIKGIGPRMAARIVEHFGSDTLVIMEREPERLAEVKGISSAKACEIGEQFAAQSAAREAMVFLQGFGLTPNMSMRIYKEFGLKTVSVLSQNPYISAVDFPHLHARAMR